MEPRPLYLNGTLPIEVRLDGPALRVLAEHKAPRLYPLRYLERIQTSNQVNWQTQALLACAIRGISIQFTDAEGLTLARLVGQSSRPHSLVERLRQCMALPGWQRRYQDWRHGRRLQTQRYIAIKLGYHFRDSKDLEALPAWCENQLNGKGGKDRLGACLQWLHGDLHGYIVQRLREKGIVDDSLLLAEPIDLAADLTAILGSHLLLIRQQGMKRHSWNTKPTRKLAAEWFNQRRGYLRYQLDRMLNLLELWTRETR